MGETLLGRLRLSRVAAVVSSPLPSQHIRGRIRLINNWRDPWCYTLVLSLSELHKPPDPCNPAVRFVEKKLLSSVVFTR